MSLFRIWCGIYLICGIYLVECVHTRPLDVHIQPAWSVQRLTFSPLLLPLRMERRNVVRGTGCGTSHLRWFIGLCVLSISWEVDTLSRSLVRRWLFVRGYGKNLWLIKNAVCNWKTCNLVVEGFCILLVCYICHVYFIFKIEFSFICRNLSKV
jgi:hypothetical protein